MQTIKEIEAQLLLCKTHRDITQLNLEEDTRIGVKRAVLKHKKRIDNELKLAAQFEAMLHYERHSGAHLIAGIDEAGRGPIAGDVVAAAVILPKDFQLLGLNDSKQLSHEKRMAFRAYIMAHAHYGIGAASPEEIDAINIYEATKLAMIRAVNALHVKPEHLLIDAMTLDTSIPQTKIIKGDAHSVSIAAASILAKTERDITMQKLHEKYPMYGFSRHKGYGTKQHIEALKTYGASAYHRKTFEPVTTIIHKNGYIE